MLGPLVGSAGQPPDGLSAGPARVLDRQVIPHVIAAIGVFGGLLGSLNLVFDGALRPETAPRVGYLLTMATCVCFGLAAWMRPSLVHRAGLVIVLLADVIYVVVTWAIKDARMYSTPLMLLFAALLAAWLLTPRTLPIHLIGVYAMCWFALAPTIDAPRLLVVQIVVQGTVLNGATVLVFLLRHRSERLLTQMHRASVTDQLTGLPNRRSLDEHAPDLWAKATVDGHLVAGLILDLDHFKAVNDIHGHTTGDRVLSEVAKVIQGSLRADDLVARTGGEEFVVLTAAADEDSAMALAERIRAAVATIRDPVPVTVSIGVVLEADTHTSDAVNATWRLIDYADRAMYDAKTRGRDQAVLLQPDIRRSASPLAEPELTHPDLAVQIDQPDTRHAAST